MKRIFLIPLLSVGLAAGEGSRELSGIVLDPDGKPMAGVRVSLRGAHACCRLVPGYSFASTVTNADGSFRIERPPVAMDLEVRHPLFAPSWGAAADNAEFRLRRPAYIAGTTVPGCRVRATHGLRELAAATAGNDGSYKLGPLPPNLALLVSVESECHRPLQEWVALVEGETRTLDAAPESGTVLEGRTLPGATVRASQGEARESIAVADERGAFRLTGLCEGPVCVVVLSAERAPVVLHATTGDFLDTEASR